MSAEPFVGACLDAVKSGALRERDWCTADALQIEWPNAITPNGAERDLAQLRGAEAKGRQIVERQSYDVTRLLAPSSSICPASPRAR